MAVVHPPGNYMASILDLGLRLKKFLSHIFPVLRIHALQFNWLRPFRFVYNYIKIWQLTGGLHPYKIKSGVRTCINANLTVLSIRITSQKSLEPTEKFKNMMIWLHKKEKRNSIFVPMLRNKQHGMKRKVTIANKRTQLIMSNSLPVRTPGVYSSAS